MLSNDIAAAHSTMRIVTLGLPLAALLLVHDKHNVVLAGLRSGLTLGQRRLRSMIGIDRVVTDPHKDWSHFRKRMEALQPDLLVSWFFTRRIPMDVVQTCPLQGIGIHPSMLPRHRGPDPYFAAIDAGDTVTGVTVHRLEEDYDTGDILAQQTLPIHPRWNAWQLARALDRPSLELLRKTVARIAARESIHALPQDASVATYAHAPTIDDRILRWNRRAADIVRRILALAPNPGALAWFAQSTLVVHDACVRDSLPCLEPGEAAIIDGVAVVRASDRGVALLRGEIDGALVGPEDIAQQIGSGADDSRSCTLRSGDD